MLLSYKTDFDAEKNEGNIQTFISNSSGSGCCKYITETRLLVDFLWEKMNTKRIGAFLIDFIITAMIMNIPFRILVIYPTIKGNQPSDIIARTLISTLLAFSYLILRYLPKKGSIGKRLGDRLTKTEIAER